MAKFGVIPVVPDGWRISMCIYAICFAISLLFTPAVYEQPMFQSLRGFGIPYWAWVIALLSYASAGIVSVLFPARVFYAGFGVCGVIIWSFLGTELIVGGFMTTRQISPAGLYSISGAVGCFLTVLQSVNREDRS